jgi:hypothetical protein
MDRNLFFNYATKPIELHKFTFPDRIMAENSANSGPLRPPAGDVTSELVERMQSDLVFVMRFIGESQLLMLNHFQQFILRELALTGVTPETHPMLHAFAEKHALMLRDFVFSGVSLSRQLRVDDIERLTGDTMIRVDVWDQLRSHITMAESQFRSQLPELPVALEVWKAP